MGSSISDRFRRIPIFNPITEVMWSYLVLAPLSGGYPGLMGRLPTHYSPVRRSTQGVAPSFSLDLHVLGAPLAFALSQDQTLHFKLWMFICYKKFDRLTWQLLFSFQRTILPVYIIEQLSHIINCTTLQTREDNIYINSIFMSRKKCFFRNVV